MRKGGTVKHWLDPFKPEMAPSDELRAFDRFVLATIAHEKAWTEFDEAADKFDRKPKYREEFYTARRKVEKTFLAQFGAYDAWRYIATTLIQVPERDIRSIVTDALMRNADALGWVGTGLENHRAAESLSASIYKELQTIGVRVVEEEQSIPYCEDCA